MQNELSALFERESAPVAQWIEQLTSDQQVGGSNPSGRARFRPSRRGAAAIRHDIFGMTA